MAFPAVHPAALALPYHREIGRIQVTPLHGYWSEVQVKTLTRFAPPLLLSYRPAGCLPPRGHLLLLVRVPPRASAIDELEVVALRNAKPARPVRLVDAAIDHNCTLEDFMRDVLVLVQAPEIPRPNRMHSSSRKLLWVPFYTVLPSNPASFTYAEPTGVALTPDETEELVGDPERLLLHKLPSAVPAVSGLVPRWAKRGYAARSELMALYGIRQRMLGDADDSDDGDDDGSGEPAVEVPPEPVYGAAEELAGEHPPDENDVLPAAAGAGGRRRPPTIARVEKALKAKERPDDVTALVRDYLDQFAEPGASAATGPPPAVPVLRSVDWIKRIVRAAGIYDIALVRFAVNPRRPVWIRRNALLLVEEHMLQRRGGHKSLKIARDTALRNVELYERREAELNAGEPDGSGPDAAGSDDDGAGLGDTELATLEEQAQASLMRSLLPDLEAGDKRTAAEAAALQAEATARVAAMTDAEFEAQMEVHRKRIRLNAEQHQ